LHDGGGIEGLLFFKFSFQWTIIAYDYLHISNFPDFLDLLSFSDCVYLVYFFCTWVDRSLIK